MSRRRFRLAAAGLLAIGAVLRLWWQTFILTDPSWWLPHGNTGGFLRTARTILSGDVLAGDSPFFYGPLYSYFLAACFSLSGGEHFLLPRLLQALMGLVLAVIVARLALRLFGERAALCAMALMLVYGSALFFEGLLVATTLSTLLLLLGVDLLFSAHDTESRLPVETGRLLALLLAGASFGLAAWGRGNVLLLLPPAALWILWRSAPREGAPLKRLLPVLSPLRVLRVRPVLPVLSFTLGACLLILPVTVRNAVVSGDRVLLVSQGGLNFFVGNNPESPGWFSPPEASGLVDDNDQAWEANSRRVAEAAEGRTLKPSEVSNWWMARGLAFFREEPATAAALLLTKCRLLLDPYELPIHRNAQVFLAEFPLGRALPGWATLLGLSAAGLALARFGTGRRPSLPRKPLQPLPPPLPLLSLLLLLLALVYAASVVAFFVVDRYRFPLVPLLAPFAGHGLASLLGAARDLLARRRPEGAPRLLVAALLAVGLPALLHAPGLSPVSEEVRGRYEALEYYRRAKAWERLEDRDEALATYERALRAAPGHVPSRLRQCRLLIDAGRPQEAAEILRLLLSVAPSQAEAARLLEEAEAAVAVGEAASTQR